MLTLKKFRNLASSKGFTLVELLVVIAIIGVLATLVLLQLGVARQKARDAKRVADINQIRSALELYFDDNGIYIVGTNLTAGLGPASPGAYLTVIPSDPLVPGCANDIYDGIAVGDVCYGYAHNPAASPTRFHIWSELERRAASALNGDSDINSTGWSGAPINGATEANPCVISTTVADCIYDTGQQ